MFAILGIVLALCLFFPEEKKLKKEEVPDFFLKNKKTGIIIKKERFKMLSFEQIKLIMPGEFEYIGTISGLRVTSEVFLIKILGEGQNLKYLFCSSREDLEPKILTVEENEKIKIRLTELELRLKAKKSIEEKANRLLIFDPLISESLREYKKNMPKDGNCSELEGEKIMPIINKINKRQKEILLEYQKELLGEPKIKALKNGFVLAENVIMNFAHIAEFYNVDLSMAVIVPAELAKLDFGYFKKADALNDLRVLDTYRPYRPYDSREDLSILGGKVFCYLIGLKESFEYYGLKTRTLENICEYSKPLRFIDEKKFTPGLSGLKINTYCLVSKIIEDTLYYLLPENDKEITDALSARKIKWKIEMETPYFAKEGQNLYKINHKVLDDGTIETYSKCVERHR